MQICRVVSIGRGSLKLLERDGMEGFDVLVVLAHLESGFLVMGAGCKFAGEKLLGLCTCTYCRSSRTRRSLEVRGDLSSRWIKENRHRLLRVYGRMGRI